MPGFQFMFFYRYWSHIQYHVSISWFLKDIEPIFDIFKNIRQIARIVRHASFPTLSNCWSSDISKSTKLYVWNDFIVFFRYLESFGGPKIKHNGVGESWPRQKNQKSWQWWLFSFTQSEIEKWLVQNEAESFYGAFGLIS